MRDKLMRLIFEALVTTQDGGLDFQPGKMKQIHDTIERTALSKDVGDTTVVYEVAGYLRKTGSPRACDALLSIMMSMAGMIEQMKSERELLAGMRIR
jgi:hypothetical protein